MNFGRKSRSSISAVRRNRLHTLLMNICVREKSERFITELKEKRQQNKAIANENGVNKESGRRNLSPFDIQTFLCVDIEMLL